MEYLFWLHPVPYVRLSNISAFSCKEQKKLSGLYISENGQQGYFPITFFYPQGVCTIPNVVQKDSLKLIFSDSLDFQKFGYRYPSDWCVYKIENDSITILWISYWSAPMFGELCQATGKIIGDKIVLNRGLRKDSKTPIYDTFIRRNTQYIPDTSFCPYLKPKYQRKLRRIHCGTTSNVISQ